MEYFIYTFLFLQALYSYVQKINGYLFPACIFE